MKFSPTPLHSYSGARAGWDVNSPEMNEPGLVCISSRFGKSGGFLVLSILTKSLPYPSFKKHRATMMGEEVKQSKVYQIVMQVG